MIFIARAIQQIYNSELRDFAVHETEVSGTAVRFEKPEWKLSSIRRHLLMSTETEAVFESYQNQIYKSMIVRQVSLPPRPSRQSLDSDPPARRQSAWWMPTAEWSTRARQRSCC